MKLKTVASIITFTLISTTMSQATPSTCTQCCMSGTQNYHTMNTEDLQVEVEKHSNRGEVPFELGLELMKRWRNS